MRIAHLSDLHVLNLTGTPWTKFLNKRLTGLANLHGARRNAHPIAIARKLGDAVRAAGAEHVIVTGDLTNLSLDSEMLAAREVIASIGPPEFVTLIPGNHDVYTRGALASGRFEEAFDAYLPRHDDGRLAGRSRYPIVTDIGENVRIYGLSSAIPAPPLCAWGEVGRDQLDRLKRLVANEPKTINVRIVLVHHNMHSRGRIAERTAQLKDRADLAAALRHISATMLLHGHTHDPNQWHLQAQPGGKKVLVLGCGSSTQSKPEHPDRARFNIIDIANGNVSAVTAHEWRSALQNFMLLPDDLLAAANRRSLNL